MRMGGEALVIEEEGDYLDSDYQRMSSKNVDIANTEV